MRPAQLVLEDGTVFAGSAVGAPGVAAGEACFTTAMAGYEEAASDPSYMAQVLCLQLSARRQLRRRPGPARVGRRVRRGDRDAQGATGLGAVAGVAGSGRARGRRHTGARPEDSRRRRASLRARRGAGRRAARARARRAADRRPAARQAGRHAAAVSARCGSADYRARPRLQALDPHATGVVRPRGHGRPRRLGRGGDPRDRAARRARQQRARRPGRARRADRDGPRPARPGAALRHLPRPPDPRARARAGDVQAPVRAPRREPSRARRHARAACS